MEIIPKPTAAQARLELALWQAEADSVSNSDLYLWLRERGLPDEAAMRLKNLVELTAKVGGKLVSLGKIILIKLIEFVERNPNLALGTAFGAAFSLLIGAIPILGPVLAPIALPLGVFIGAIAGNRLDKLEQLAKEPFNPSYMVHGNGCLTIPQDAIEIARKCLEHLIATLHALMEELQLIQPSTQ